MKDTESTTTLKPCPHCGSINLRGPHCTDYHGDTYAPQHGEQSVKIAPPAWKLQEIHQNR